MKLENEEVMHKNNWNLDNELNRPVHEWEAFNTKKSCVL